LVLRNFAGTKHFERYREENVIGRNVKERFSVCYVCHFLRSTFPNGTLVEGMRRSLPYLVVDDPE